MIYSSKTLFLATLLFLLSTITLGVMHLPLLNGQNGFKAMENTFNSLRKGISPPFEKLNTANKVNLGKSFSANLTFSTTEITSVAARVLLRNKLMVTPKGRTLRVQGDLGYTLQYFMKDIQLLYFNENKKLENKYGMPATQSMFILDRILKKLAISLASNKMTEQEKLTNKIRLKELVPAYNLRSAPPIHIVSGATYFAIGTLGLLLITTLWDFSNLLFFRTITDISFLKKISGIEKKEKRAALIKKQIARKKKAAILAKKAKAAAEDAKKAKAPNGTDKKKVARKKPTTEGSQKPVKKVTDPTEKKKTAVKQPTAKSKEKLASKPKATKKTQPPKKAKAKE